MKTELSALAHAVGAETTASPTQLGKLRMPSRLDLAAKVVAYALLATMAAPDDLEAADCHPGKRKGGSRKTTVGQLIPGYVGPARDAEISTMRTSRTFGFENIYSGMSASQYLRLATAERPCISRTQTGEPSCHRSCVEGVTVYHREWAEVHEMSRLQAMREITGSINDILGPVLGFAGAQSIAGAIAGQKRAVNNAYSSSTSISGAKAGATAGANITISGGAGCPPTQTH